MDKLSQLDELMESDILEALGKDTSNNSDTLNEKEITIENSQDIKEAKIEDLSLNSDLNSTDLLSLINELLSNKTLEITIKIKD